jgi:hypothetical protein
VSSDLGQLVVCRHLISGIDCAIAGVAIAAVPALKLTAAPVFMNLRLLTFVIAVLLGSRTYCTFVEQALLGRPF